MGQSVAPSSGKEPSPQARDQRILLVDDDNPLRNALSRYLSRFGCVVHTACNGREALLQLESVTVDIVVTDIIMPDKEGVELIMELSKLYPGMKIIAMSGGGRLGPGYYLQSARLLGASRVLVKPFQPEALLLAIREVLAGR